MEQVRTIRVVVDTNVWISFLIGKRLRSLLKLVADRSVTLVFAPQLIREIETVTSRPSLSKYFASNDVRAMIKLLKQIGEEYLVEPINNFEPDPKDSFLLDLLSASAADYLVTGDKALLRYRTFESTLIISPSEFEKILKEIRM